MKSTPSIYLAGPTVFLRDSNRAFEQYEAWCRAGLHRREDPLQESQPSSRADEERELAFDHEATQRPLGFTFNVFESYFRDIGPVLILCYESFLFEWISPGNITQGVTSREVFA